MRPTYIPSQPSVIPPEELPEDSGEPPLFRKGLATVLMSFAIVFAVVALKAGHTTPMGSILVNLSTEVAGIAITVAIVEKLLERRTKWDESKRLAWRVLRDLDYAVWVWQGGRRGLIIDELQGLLDAAQAGDPLPHFTETLLLHLGSSAEFACQRQADVVAASPHLKNALACLRMLSSIRDKGGTPRTEIRSYLQQATRSLAKALDLKISQAPANEISRVRDASVHAQAMRRFGRRRRALNHRKAKGAGISSRVTASVSFAPVIRAAARSRSPRTG